MHASHHTLSLLVADLSRRFEGALIDSIFSQERDELIVTFADRPECLFISCSSNLPMVFLYDSFVRARRNSVDLLTAAGGTYIAGVAVHPSDRILTFRLSSGSVLEIRLFGMRSNVYLLDNKRIVIDAFKRGRATVGTPLTQPLPVEHPTLTQQVQHLTSAGTTFPITSTARETPEGMARHTIPSGPSPTAALPVEQSGKPATTIQAALKNTLPIVSQTVVRELVHRAGLSSGALIRDIGPEQWSALFAAALQIERELMNPRPIVVSTLTGLPLRFSTIPLHHLPETRETAHPDIHTGLREFYVQRRSAEAFQGEQQQLRDRLRRRIEKVERTCEAIRTDVAETDRARTYREFGARLMEHLGTITKGVTTWTWTDGESSLEIPLIPSLTPVQNAQRYFEKAKSAERSRLLTEDRLRAYGAILTRARNLLSELESISTRFALRAFMKQQKEPLRSVGASESEQDKERAPFRVFVVHGGFEVWAGKSSINNDDLTMHHTRPEDLWFHARGASGSHVILKISSAPGEPGKRARQEAAAIAAYYSKMRKARIVPVAMTRRKYVHKPRGAPPGTVVITREEVLMATPGLPKVPAHTMKEENPDA